MSSLKIIKATSLLEGYFGKDTPQAQAAISLTEKGYFANPSGKFSQFTFKHRQIFEKCGGLPSFNYGRHGLKLISAPLEEFPIFDVEGKTMQFVAQVFLRVNDYNNKGTIEGMLFFFIDYQDANNYEESCPLCKVIHEPDIPAGFLNFTQEHADDIGMTVDRLNLYHRGIGLTFLSTLTLPEPELLLSKFPDLFSWDMLKKYNQKVLNKGPVAVTSTIMGGNPRVLQSYPIEPDERFLIQMYDPRPISSENYIFYFALKQDAYEKRDFSDVTILGQVT